MNSTKIGKNLFTVYKKPKLLESPRNFGYKKSARRDSNPRPRPWQGRTPPTEPLALTDCLPAISTLFGTALHVPSKPHIEFHPFFPLFYNCGYS